MATVAKDITIWTKTTTGGPPATMTYPEAATQTFKAGWIVALNASGYVIDPASDTPSLILGLAVEDAHNAAAAGTSEIDVYLAIPSNLFAANCLETSLADHVLTQADIGHVMGIQRDTVNNRLFLNASVAAGANIRVFTYEIAQGQPATPTAGFGPFVVGDTNVRLVFAFLPNWSSELATS